jgi:hypothetical protein
MVSGAPADNIVRRIVQEPQLASDGRDAMMLKSRDTSGSTASNLSFVLREQSATFAQAMFLSMIILVAVAIAVREHWNRLDNNEPGWIPLLRKWFLQGFVIPSTAWSLINLGLSNRFPALIPKLAYAQANDQVWWNLWVQAVIEGAAFIAIVWASITYIWLMFRTIQATGNTREFRRSLFLIGIPMFLLAFIIVNRSSWALLPIGILTVFMPLVHVGLGQAEKPLPHVSYSRAIGQINFGKYEDAEVEVIHQLEKKENDFQGWMMLAELYASKYKRLDDAARVVVDLCNDPSIQPVEISVACHKLADWQLQIGENPAGARAALDLLIRSIPGTHFAEMAQIRLRQIPRTREDYVELKKPRPIRLPSLREHFDESAAGEKPVANKQEATSEANRLSARLQDDPNDFETRERLAILLAENLGHVKLAMEQLRLIIKIPDNPPEFRARWLGHIANWERRLNKNEQAFKSVLNEIIRDFPATSQAYSARRQLQLLEYDAIEKAEIPPATKEPIRLKVPEA